jgi:homoserine kinase
VRVPASTSNLGSGFDTLGLAVRLYAVVRVTRREGRGVTVASGEPDPSRLALMLKEAADLFFQRTRRPGFGMDVAIAGKVPVARGLGASATARVGLLAGLDALAGTRLSREQLLQMVTRLEGHPDNASPAIFGGFTVSGVVRGDVRCLSFPVSPKLKCVTLIPGFGISTEAARALLPISYSKADTTHALNRAALISAAMAAGRYEELSGIFDDRVHQPYRARLIPILEQVVRAGERAGALGGFLSGSGSGILCLTLHKAEAVARAMQRVLRDSTMQILTVDNKGFSVSH